MPELRPPQFTFSEVQPNLFHLKYASKRQGLTPMVTGLIHGLAGKFGHTISMKLFSEDPTAGEYIFEISILEKR